MRQPSILSRKQAILQDLYYKRQKSVQEIAVQLGVGMSAIYRFMRKHNLARRDFRTLNQLRFSRKPPSYHLKSRLSAIEEKLKIAGLFLYWAEGAKGGHTVDFANSNVGMCKIFIQFLRQICGIDESRLRGYLYCHENQDPQDLIRFWSKTLELPRAQFTKPYVRRYENDRDGVNKRPERMPYGLVHIRYSDVKLLQQINNWIEDYKQQFGQVPK